MKRRIKLGILVFSAAVIIMVSSIYYSKAQKIEKLFNWSGFNIESSIKNFYLYKGYFPNSYTQVTELIEKEFNDGIAKDWNYLKDPFTEGYFKIILIKSEDKEKNGALIISAGLNGKFDNDYSEISINDISKLKLTKRAVNDYSYKPKLWEYLYSDKDIVMGYFCDEFQYLEGHDYIYNSSLFKNFKSLDHRRVFIKGFVTSCDNENKVFSISINKQKVLLHDIENIKSISVGDTVNVSALVDASEKGKYKFRKCKVYPFELSRKNRTEYKDKMLEEVGLSLTNM